MTSKKINLPLIILKNKIVLVGEVITVELFKARTILAFENAMQNDEKIFITNDVIDGNKIDDSIIDTNGVIAKIKKNIRITSSMIKLTLEIIQSAKVKKIIDNYIFTYVELEQNYIKNNLDYTKEQAIIRKLKNTFSDYAQEKGSFSNEHLLEILSEDNIYTIRNNIINNIYLQNHQKNEYIKKKTIRKQIETLIIFLNEEIEILKIQKEINKKVKKNIDEIQKRFYLNEQIKVINDELGNKSDLQENLDNYKKNLKSKNIPSYAKDKIEKEISKLSKMLTSSNEYSVCNEYIKFSINLPWDNKTKVNYDLENITKVLNKEHFAMEKIKERIIEHIAVLKNTNNKKNTILCLVGPPGVGKTSIAKSIAKAINLKYTKIALGGIKDEAELRGHRKTYVGAMSGRILKCFENAGVNNPLILLDEIDKISSDFRGNPSDAMLEILDKEQNLEFRDNYLEMPFDISSAMFICTANDIFKIDRALRDRLEVINLSSYTKEEKEQITAKFLIPKQMTLHNIDKNIIKINKQAIKIIIDEYTKEAGVRALEREIETICRKIVKVMIEQKETNQVFNITPKNIKDYLGQPKFKMDKATQKSRVGSVCGLAFTSVGGTTLNIEVNIMKGSGKTIITGNVGKVMNESAHAGISYIRANVNRFGISEDFYKLNDIHIHIPEGAVPKDGPSAGITMATAIYSALTNKKVNKEVAMTGEITLRGNVLPIGGLKEKILAAKRIGIKIVLIPQDNMTDLMEIPEYVYEGLKIIAVKDMIEVIQNAIL